MGLFGSKQAANLKAMRETVEKVIAELGLDPRDNRLETQDGSFGWGLMRGSAQVFLFIKPGEEDEHFNAIQVVAPVMHLPESSVTQGTLFRRLLELNSQELTSAAFAIKDDTVVVSTARSTEDLDRSEIKQMLLRVGYYADTYDDILVNQFGGRRYSD